MLERGNLLFPEIPVVGDTSEEGEDTRDGEKETFKEVIQDRPRFTEWGEGGHEESETLAEGGGEDTEEGEEQDEEERLQGLALDQVCAPLESGAVGEALGHDDDLEECRADGVEESGDDEEESPEEDEALPEDAGEEEGEHEWASSSEEYLEGGARAWSMGGEQALSHKEDTPLSPHGEEERDEEDDQRQEKQALITLYVS